MFTPSVPVFDGHVALGRRHDQRVRVDSADGLLDIMNRSGIDRALVYHRYAVEYDTRVGNRMIMETVANATRLVPQHVANMPSDDMTLFQNDASLCSLRVFPRSHLYPFTPWIAGPWTEWLSEKGVALWVSADEVDMRDLHQTALAFPGVSFVLSGVHYGHFAQVWPLSRVLPNLYIELSRLDIMDGVTLFIRRIGAGRLIFGSHFPDLDPAPYLFYLHRCRMNEEDLKAICHDNLAGLLSGSKGKA